MDSLPESRKEVNEMSNNNEQKNTWNYNRKTDTRWVDVLSEADTPVSRSTGCLLHDCPGCSNIWALSPYGRTPNVVSRAAPLRDEDTGKNIGFIITAARLADACWCGVPFPEESAQSVTENQARNNLKAALRIALAREGEKPTVVDEIQTLRGKITPSVLHLLRGERKAKAEGVA